MDDVLFHEGFFISNPMRKVRSIAALIPFLSFRIELII